MDEILKYDYDRVIVDESEARCAGAAGDGGR